MNARCLPRTARAKLAAAAEAVAEFDDAYEALATYSQLLRRATDPMKQRNYGRAFRAAQHRLADAYSGATIAVQELGENHV